MTQAVRHVPCSTEHRLNNAEGLKVNVFLKTTARKEIVIGRDF